MTRLEAEQIRMIPAGLQGYDNELKLKTGSSLKQLAALAVGINPAKWHPEDYRVAVIPFTTGLGVIESFSEAVCAIAGHLGFRSSITVSADAGGLAEAFAKRADVIIMADDNVYVAVNLDSRRVSDNAEATARGYTAALERMAGGLKSREVLLIGAGKVGQKAAEALLEAKAKLIIFDLDKNAETMLAAEMSKKFHASIQCGMTLEKAFERFPLIFDASPGLGFIGAGQVSGDTIAVAPGIPLGFQAAALKKLGPRLIHDPLQIGTAVMLYQVFT